MGASLSYAGCAGRKMAAKVPCHAAVSFDPMEKQTHIDRSSMRFTPYEFTLIIL
jgi:hypothetical protein